MSLVKPIYNILSQTEEKILAIIEQNPKVSFRSILKLLQQEYGAQEVWGCLKDLRGKYVIEMVKLSNRKVGYKVQVWQQ